jgi:single-strand DNA-binding protein
VSRSLNKAILIGNVGGDPEIRSVGTGSRVAQFSLATSRTWNDQGGNKQEKTEWHRCVVWNNARGPGLVDVVEKYVKKGEKIYVEGEIEYRQWQDKDGQTRYTTEIKVRELMLLGGGGGRGGMSGDDMDSAPRRSSAPAPRAAAKPAASGGDDFNDFPGALEDEDDDLPF